MYKYRIYLNNNNLADAIDIVASYPQIMGSITIFYDNDDEVVASIPNHIIFIKMI